MAQNQQTTSELIAKLKTMATKAGESLFERATMAAKVLADREWIAAECGGDYDRAHELIELECFPDMSGYGLSKLLALIETFPDVETWRRHKFNLNRLWIERSDKRKAERGDGEGEPKERKSKAELIAEKVEEIELRSSERVGRALLDKQEAEARAATMSAELAALREQNRKLEAENNQLRGELAALNRMMRDIRKRQQTAVA